MQPHEIQIIRLSLLRHLDANGTRYGLATGLLRCWIAAEGFKVSDADLEKELAYLADKKLVEDVNKKISPELRAWRITADGRDELAKLS